MKTYIERKEMIAAALAKFPGEFGLRAFPGQVFRVSTSATYVNDHDVVMFVTETRRPDGSWSDWAKGTEAELRREMVLKMPLLPGLRKDLEKLEAARQELHKAATMVGLEERDPYAMYGEALPAARARLERAALAFAEASAAAVLGGSR